MLERLQSRLIGFLLRGIDRTTAVLTAYRASLSGMDVGVVAAARHRKDEMTRTIRLLIRLRYAMDLIVPAVVLVLAFQGLRLESPARNYGTTLAYLESMWPNFTLAGVGLALNASYRILLKRHGNLRPVAYAQVWLDILIFGLMIYTTGGITSPFPFLLTVPVLAAGMLLSFRASLEAALSATAVMAVQALLQHLGVIPTQRYFAPMLPLLQNGGYVVALVILNGVLYFLIALTCGALTRTIHAHERALAARANEASMLSEVSSTLQATTHLDDVLARIMDILLVRLDLDRALMYLVGGNGDTLDLKLIRYHPRHVNPPPHNLKVQFDLRADGGVAPTVVREKQVFNIMDPLNHPLINQDLAKRIGLNPFAIAPMLARGKAIGTIGVDRHVRAGIITQEEAQLLAVAANQAALTIQNARLYEGAAATPTA